MRWVKRLNKQTAKAIAYAQDALTFLFLDNEEKGKIKGIYLFGSAVRGELEKESDIDLFIDCKNLMNHQSRKPLNARSPDSTNRKTMRNGRTLVLSIPSRSKSETYTPGA